MAPESLVTVNRFGTPEMAEEDLRTLQEAGLNAYLGGEYHRYGEAVELKAEREFEAREHSLKRLSVQQPSAESGTD